MEAHAHVADVACDHGHPAPSSSSSSDPVNLTNFCPTGLGDPDVPALEALFNRLHSNATEFGEDFHEVKNGKLDLCKQRLGPVFGSRLAEAMRDNKTVQSLLLGADGLGPVGANALGANLVSNRTLQTLFLGCNKIGPSGAKALSETLVGNTALTALWLKRNDIETEGLAAIVKALDQGPAALVTLDLVSNKIDLAGIKILTTHLQHNQTLRYLYLGNNELTERECLPLGMLLRQNTPLRALYLSINPIGDKGAALLGEALKANDKLTELAMSSCAITDAGATLLAGSLATNRGLRVLDLGFRIGTKMLGAEPNYLTAESVPPLMRLVEENHTIVQIHLDSKVRNAQQLEAILAARRASIPRWQWYEKRPDLTAITSIYRGAVKDKALHAAGNRKRARNDLTEEQLDHFARSSYANLTRADEWQREILDFYQTELLRRSSSCASEDYEGTTGKEHESGNDTTGACATAPLEAEM